MSTTAQNNQSYAKGATLPYPVSTGGSFDINGGDLVWYDSSAHLIKPMTSDANMQYSAGVASDSSFLNITGTKVYPDSGTLEVFTGGRFTFNTTSGDTLNHGDAVYAGADAQTVTNQSATYVIGYVWLRDGQSAVSGGAGVTIDVLIAPKFPAVGVN